MRTEAAHQRKANKYAHFLTDIRDYSMNVKPFEVGAHTGYINDRNKASLTNIHKYAKTNIKFKFKYFKEIISAITSVSSHFIFNARKSKEWSKPGYVGPQVKV